MAIDLGRSDASFVASPVTNENAGTQTHAIGGKNIVAYRIQALYFITRLFVGEQREDDGETLNVYCRP